MRLLIVTQTVDRKDSTLGYYHRWLTELAERFENIIVFSLRVGEYDLPHNVSVVQIRPWGYRARVRTALRVLRLAWKYRGEYDAVLVHMNQEYLLVAGWLWKALVKKIYFWRNHYEGTFLTDVASFFCDKIFYTSKSSYTAKYVRAVQMPVGVDVDSCHLDEPIPRVPRSILFLGRFDSSKRPDLLVDALGKLSSRGESFTASFVGGPSDHDPSFPEKVARRAKEIGLEGKVSFVGPVPNTDTYTYYRSHALYVNCGKSGMFDKSLFKSIACGCLPLFASRDMAEIVGTTFQYKDGDADDLASRLSWALALPQKDREEYVKTQQAQTIDAHSLPVLARRLAEEITT